VRVVDLGAQPASDHFPLASDPSEDPRWPLELWLCTACTLVQLGPVDPGLTEPPRAIESATSRDHARQSVGEIFTERPSLKGAAVYEFASHHGGSWLDELRQHGCRSAAAHEPADLVVDVHALAHEVAVGDAIRVRAQRLATGGLLVLEFHHLLLLYLEGQFDTVRHGHWSYLSLRALQNLTVPHGLVVLSAQVEPVFGGSLRATLAHRDAGLEPDSSVESVLADEGSAGLADADALARFQNGAASSAVALHNYLAALKEDGKSVAGYGAPSKAPVLLGLAGVDDTLLPYTVDASPAKHGRRLPGCLIPIHPVAELRRARPDVVLVLTWDIAHEVIAQLEADGGWGAEYVVPLPRPHALAQ